MSEQRILEAELTWIDGRFRRGVRVVVGADGRVVEVLESAPQRRSAAATEGTGNREQATGAAARSTHSQPEAAGSHASQGQRGTGGPGGGEVLRLAGRALIPGFVNAHSHAFQRALRGRTQRFPEGAGDFWSWREAMYGWVQRCSVEAFGEVCRRAFEEMRAAGFTTVGEFHYLHHADAARVDFAMDEALIEAARQAGIRLVLIGTYYAAGGLGEPLRSEQRRFVTPDVDGFLAHMDALAARAGAGGLHSVAIAGHSIRAVPTDDLLRLRAEARRRGWMFHMHIEEQPAEIEQCVAALGVTPMRWVLDHADAGSDFVVVHATHTHREVLAEYVERGGRVCVCPITEADLGDGIADVPTMAEPPAALSIGSDSNVRIDPTEELRWLEYAQRLRLGRRGVLRDEAGDVPRRLLEIGTTGGAAALGIDAGRIGPGCLGDFAVVDLEHPALAGADEDGLLEAILVGAGRACVAGSIVGGRVEERKAE